MKNIVKSFLSAAGVEIRLHRNIERAYAAEKAEAFVRPWRLLLRYKPATILDIGANDGYSVSLFRKIFPTARILSFEPLEDCFRLVQSRISELPPGKAYRCALGDEDGTSVIHRSDFSPSSSLLPMDVVHQIEFPHTAITREETITIRRLDSMVDELELDGPFIAKIDVQGFEDRVIRGGEQTLRKALAIVVELSTYSLYKQQAAFADVHSQLEKMGFVFRGTIDQMFSPKDGRILQFDGLFENTLFEGASESQS